MRPDPASNGPLVLVIDDPERLSADAWRALREAGVRTFASTETPRRDPAPVERLRTAVRTADLESAERVLRDGGLPLALDHREVIEGWVDAPPAGLGGFPALRWALVALAARHRRDQLPALLSEPWGETDRRRPAADRALARGLRCAVERRLARPNAVTTAVALDSMLHDLGRDDLEALGAWLPALYAECGMALLHDGRVFHARTVLTRGLATASDVWWQRALGAAVALTDIVLGNVRAAARRRSACPVTAGPHPCDDLLAAVDALLALERGRTDAAERALTAVEPSADHHDIVMLVRALVALTAGRSREAADVLAAWQRTRSSTPTLIDLAEGMTLLSRSHTGGVSAVPSGAGLVSAVASAQTGVAAGDVDRVRELVARLSEEGMAATPRLRLHAAVVEFALVRRLGSRSSVRLVAERMAEIVESDGLTWPLRLLSPEDAAVFTELTGIPAPQALLDGGLPAERLTERERIVLSELVRGGTEGDIAARLQLSVNTIKTQRRSLYRKLGVTRRDEAVARGLAMGVLAPEHPRRRDWA